ncbi:MAG: sulfotransferase [Candidatus Saccharibacteria bacterium]|nr:sulfotransferase [Pseudorhodobacter sp.]
MTQVPKYHFISGLPRSGSTLLAAVLNQNPAFRAAMSSPVFNVVNAALTAMGTSNEYAIFLDDTQLAAMLRGLMDGYYNTPIPVIFDTNRMWTARLPALRQLYPQAKVIACVRNPAWILDSVETLLRKTPLVATRLFGAPMEQISVYARADGLMDKQRLLGSAYQALREAYHGADAGAMLLLDYDTFVRHPQDAMTLIYQFLEEPAFAHDFDQVTYQAEAFDTQLLAKGLHDVTGRVKPRPRPTILPPDLFKRFAALQFWGKGDSLAYAITQATVPQG